MQMQDMGWQDISGSSKGAAIGKAGPFVRNTVINTSLKYTYLSPLVREKDIGSQEIRSRASADSIPESGLVQYAFGLLQQPWHVGHFEPQYALWVRRNSQQINPIGGKKPWTPHKRSGVLSGNDWSDVLMGQDWSWHDRGIWGLGACGWHDPGIFFFWWESLLSKFGRRWWISFKMTVSWNYIYVYMFKTFMPPNWPPKEEPPAFMLNMQQINLQLWQPNDRKHQWQLISHSRTLLIFLNKRGQIPFQVVRKAGSIISASGDGMGDDSLLSLLEVLIELALAIWLSQDHCLHTSNQIWKWKICSKVWESTDYERWQF